MKKGMFTLFVILAVCTVWLCLLPQERAEAADQTCGVKYSDYLANGDNVLFNNELDKIENNSFLTDEQARIIFSVLKAESNNYYNYYNKCYEIGSCEAVFTNHFQDDHNLFIDICFVTTLTKLVTPEDSPLLKGMRAEVEDTEDEELKAIAQFLYEELKVEHTSLDGCTFGSQSDCRLVVPNDLLADFDVDKVGLYYGDEWLEPYDEKYPVIFEPHKPKTEEDGRIELRNELARYAVRLNKELRSMESKSENIDDPSVLPGSPDSQYDGNETAVYSPWDYEPTYNRSVAASYAITHATDVPEFSAANGNGSDCANFVSKCLNAGGIPVDVSGNWYPRPNGSAYAGINWMRTGYNNNGGVIPYMTGKDYFSYVPTCGPAIGCILYWTNRSHVALISYIDDTGVAWYTEHGSKPQTQVYHRYSDVSNVTMIYVCNLLWN
ncbi:MAG: amidase domain-containing protein [Lachnospiraceae bacterium]|nr:amidase domain-containing protein [Lachnospiraceae bacterium]